MTTMTDWQSRLGEVWADEWRRTDRSFAGLSRHLDAAIAAAAPASGRAVDLGCGAGETSLALATARPDLRITGVDLSPALVAIARERAATAGVTNVAFVAGAVPEALAAEALFDLAFSRHGVMFFDDPTAAFRGIAAALAPGAPIVFSCFRAAADNEWLGEITAAIGITPDAPPGYAPGPFGFADRGFVGDMLAAAGFARIDIKPVDFTYRAGAGVDPAADATAFFRRIGPVSRALATLPPDAREERTATLRERLAGRVRNGTVDFSAAAWLVSAQKQERPA